MKSLKKLAAEENSSVSEIIRSLIEESTKEIPQVKKTQNVGDWLLSLAEEAKRLKVKGPKDLASSVDKYLYGRQ